MALINCPECNKEISEKATACPHCGCPIQPANPEIFDGEYLACPKCQSKDLHSDKSGFSGGKALAGAVLTGGIGLLAGTIGSKDVYITCLKCGNKFKAGDALTVLQGKSLSEMNEKILELYRANGSILEATAFYKKETNSGLSDSMEYVKSVLRDNNIEFKDPASGGCFGVLILLILSAAFCAFL